MARNVADSETLADVHDLRAFCLVADVRSFTAAARTMGETKGTVSRRIARLERSLGVPLLRRSPRVVELTEDGAAYRLRVGRILELLADANTEVRHAWAAPSGHLRVTAPLDFAMHLLAPRLAAFGRRFPDVSIDLVLTEKRLDLETDAIDVAFRASRELPDSSLIAHRLIAVDAVAVASPDYVREHGAPARPADLAAHRLVVMGSTRGQRALTLVSDGRKPVTTQVRVQAAVAASDMACAKEIAAAGGGVTLVPTFLIERDVAAKRLVRLLPRWAIRGASFYLLHQGGRLLTPKVRAFRDFMLDAFGVQGRRTARGDVSQSAT